MRKKGNNLEPHPCALRWVLRCYNRYRIKSQKTVCDLVIKLCNLLSIEVNHAWWESTRPTASKQSAINSKVSNWLWLCVFAHRWSYTSAFGGPPRSSKPSVESSRGQCVPQIVTRDIQCAVFVRTTGEYGGLRAHDRYARMHQVLSKPRVEQWKQHAGLL